VKIHLSTVRHAAYVRRTDMLKRAPVMAFSYKHFFPEELAPPADIDIAKVIAEAIQYGPCQMPLFARCREVAHA